MVSLLSGVARNGGGAGSWCARLRYNTQTFCTRLSEGFGALASAVLSIFCRQVSRGPRWAPGIQYYVLRHADILRPVFGAVYLFWSYNLIILVAQAGLRGHIHTAPP